MTRIPSMLGLILHSVFSMDRPVCYKLHGRSDIYSCIHSCILNNTDWFQILWAAEWWNRQRSTCLYLTGRMAIKIEASSSRKSPRICPSMECKALEFSRAHSIWYLTGYCSAISELDVSLCRLVGYFMYSNTSTSGTTNRLCWRIVKTREWDQNGCIAMSSSMLLLVA